jgi:short/branched chain acyl-CoA dehydrogenase
MQVDPSVSVLVDIHNTLNVTLVKRLGTRAQCAAWLPRMAADTVTSFCLSEAGSGSDAFAMRTRAQRQGDAFVLNGTKPWISNASEAGLFIVMANAAPEKVELARVE